MDLRERDARQASRDLLGRRQRHPVDLHQRDGRLSRRGAPWADRFRHLSGHRTAAAGGPPPPVVADAVEEVKLMLEVRRSLDRGYADHGWLKTYHTFSFADYYDPVYEEFGPLRVINEDRVKAGKGFGTHGHRDMEILTVVLEGELEHKDSLGNGSIIRPGDVQRMSAGTDVMHGESNPSPAQDLHLLQIWIKPNVAGIP